MSLEKYRKKRDFQQTPEPKGEIVHQKHHLFVIQKHAASHLHYDFRLELNGVLKSWAVPKGPCLDPNVKRLAMHVEDHPVSYGSFEGIIPKGQYGGGTVMLWDTGTWEPLDEYPYKAYKDGHLRFELHAKKLKGRWDLIRFKDEKHWFLVKYKDEYAEPLDDYDITVEEPDSVLSSQSIPEIAEHHTKIWTLKGAKKRAVKKLTPLKLPMDLTKSPFPSFIAPQLATLVNKAPIGDNWVHEVKYDGYRILAFINKGEVILKSRNNKEWTSYFPPVVKALEVFKNQSIILDGEIVLLDKEGKSNFQLLQNSIKEDGNSSPPFIYYIFDFLYYDQYELTSLPLKERKNLLEKLLHQLPSSTLVYSEHFSESGKTVFEHACNLNLEGIVSKKLDAPYVSTRSRAWVKVKCSKRQEFIIGGYTPPQGSRDHFGSLLLGVFNEEGKLEYSGKVGTGFTNKSLQEVYAQLKKRQQKNSPFIKQPLDAKKAHWVKPELVAEVEFTEWTEDERLRHPAFKGLRMDKKASSVKKEHEISASHLEKKSAYKITHPEKILYPEDGITKEDVLQYYELVSDLMVPFVKNRPLTLLRCPEGYKECFYQRHFNKSVPKVLKSVTVKDKDETDQYIYLDDKEGLFGLVQMGVLEIHPWGSQIQSIDYPDWITFDLDPAPDVAWKEVVHAALDVKRHLEQYQLTSFVKTTGGKGLHVVVPIQPDYPWDEVKNFTHVFVSFLEKTKPDTYLSTMSKTKRVGKIFIDYLRNQKTASAIGAYSTRARAHAPISTPVHWDELSSNKKDTDFTIKTIIKRIGNLKEDPWKKFWTVKQSLRLDEL